MLWNVEHNKHAKRYSNHQLITGRIFLATLCRAHKQQYCVAMCTSYFPVSWELVAAFNYSMALSMPYYYKQTNKKFILLLLLGWPSPPAQKHYGVCRAPVPISAASVHRRVLGLDHPLKTYFSRGIFDIIFFCTAPQRTVIWETVTGWAVHKEVLFLSKHSDSCLTPPWYSHSGGSKAASYWKEVSELTGEKLLEFSFTELVSVSFFARVVIENPDQGVHCIFQWSGHSSEPESCGAKILSLTLHRVKAKASL